MAQRGSVYKRQSDGKWVAQLELERTGGKRRYARAVRQSWELANDALDEMKAQQRNGLTPSHDTLGAWLEHWINEVYPGRSRGTSTAAKYAWIIDHWIVPHIGAKKLSKLAPADVRMMLSALEKAGLAPGTRAQARTVLRMALRAAEGDGLVVRNVAAIVPGPTISSARIDDALTADEAKKVLDEAIGDRLEALAVLAIKLGLRRGELVALRWQDVDLGAKTLRVAVAKTEAGRREIPLVLGTAEVLREHRRRQAEERLHAGPLWRDSGHVFVRHDGSPMSGKMMWSWWSILTTKALGGRRRFHASRHTCATLLLDQGVPLEVVSAVLGHASLGVTANIYAKVTADSKRRALTQLDDALGS
jgi:integrase